MAEINTDSYPKPAPQQGLLDTVGKYQQLESNKIGIDQQKLKLANEQFGIVSKEMSTLLGNPNVTAEDIIKSSQNLVKQGLVPPDMHAQFVSTIPTKNALSKNPDAIRQFLEQTLSRATSTMDAVNFHYGSNPGMNDLGGSQQPIQNYKGQVRATGLPVKTGLPPTTPGFQQPSPEFPQGRVVPIGPQDSPGLPVGGAQGSSPLSPKPVQTISVQRPQPAPQSPQQTPFAQRFNGVTPGEPPFGLKQGEEIAGHASAEQLAKARQSAASFQREIYPLTQAIPAMEKLGTKGTGPGTETLNHVKSFILSNVPGVTEKQLSTVKDFDEAKKYMVDFVNQTGNSGTNDKLAAAFAGNPSVNISNAAAVDVLKSALSLRLMQQAQQLEFEKTGLPAMRFSKWALEKNNQLDPRAFGVNYMSKEARQKLNEQLAKNPKEGNLFDKSLQIAHDAGYVVLGK